MSHKVLIIKKDEYEYDIERVSRLLGEGLDFLCDKDFFYNKKVLLKPNLLMPAEPDDAVTTHPHFIIASASALKKRGASVFTADNPSGFTDNKASMKQTYEKLSLDKYPDLFTLLYNDKPALVKNGIPFSWWTDSCDEIVNLPKLKTHELMILTAAVKNLYGLIPGVMKCELHGKYPKPSELSKIIIDIYKMYRPRINILDGIVALEGEGPGKRGTPKKRGLIIFSNNALALDYALTQLLRIEPMSVPYLKVALNEGLIDPKKVQVSPENWKTLAINDFILPTPSVLDTIPNPILKIFSSFMKLRPVIDTQTCQLCRRCVDICPADAIDSLQRGKRLVINNKKCIMCMCCGEVCPYGAVRKRPNPIYNFLLRINWKIKSLLGNRNKHQ